MKTRKEMLQPLIAALDDVIGATAAAGLDETAALLRIARLDLLMRVNGIHTDELEELTRELNRRLEDEAGDGGIVGHERPN